MQQHNILIKIVLAAVHTQKKLKTGSTVNIEQGSKTISGNYVNQKN